MLHLKCLSDIDKRADNFCINVAQFLYLKCIKKRLTKKINVDMILLTNQIMSNIEKANQIGNTFSF